jgi:hypothetical protein
MYFRWDWCRPSFQMWEKPSPKRLSRPFSLPYGSKKGESDVTRCVLGEWAEWRLISRDAIPQPENHPLVQDSGAALTWWKVVKFLNNSGSWTFCSSTVRVFGTNNVLLARRTVCLFPLVSADRWQLSLVQQLEENVLLRLISLFDLRLCSPRSTFLRTYLTHAWNVYNVFPPQFHIVRRP